MKRVGGCWKSLKTVTPETLNWLKDSDVTWLYGPLHTAVDWCPPARLKPDGTALLQDQPRHKPILKYRSISELLTSELPTSPAFSPTDFEDEAQQLAEIQNVSDVPVLDGKNTLSRSLNFKRPALVHTKSDTHITRWGDRAFRKESPPRIDPPGSSCIATSQSKSSVDRYFAPSQIRSTYSQDSNSSTGTSTTGLTNQRSSHAAHKKKHISFNTFVEQCIAIEKPNNEDDTPKLWGERKWDYDDGYEEDKEDNDEDDGEVWIRHTPPHLSGSAIAGSDSESGDDEGKDAEEEEDDDVLEMRPSSYSVRGTPRTQRAARSPSTSASISTPSSRSTSTSSPSRSLSPSSPCRRRQLSTSSAHPILHTSRGSTRRSSTTSTYRPRPRLYSTSHHPFLRMRARGGGLGGSHHVRTRGAPHVHVTIAPIAPTILKTTDSGYNGWAEGFGDEGGSDDGLWGGKWGVASDGEGWKEHDKVQTRDRETMPVELVYVPPPFVGRYSPGSDAEEEDFNLNAQEGRFKEQIEDAPRPSSGVAMPRIINDAPISKSPESVGNDHSFVSTVTPPSPTVVKSLLQPLQESQTRKIFVAEVASRSPSDGLIRDMLSQRPSSPEVRHSTSRSRSRTHSRSRTPSPAVNTPYSEMPPNTAAPVSLPVSSRSPSVSPPDPTSSSSLLCPPVQRGRSASYQDLPARGQRGRSSTRTPPSYSDRERQGESPIGSLSPDSSFVRVASIVGGVYASGRTDKERQKEKERREEQGRERDSGRERDRGRDRTGKRPSQSLSPDVETGTSKEFFSAEGRNDHSSILNRRSPIPEEACCVTAAPPQEVLRPLCIPFSEQDNGIKGIADEEIQWTHTRAQPTPSNSPTITMKVTLAGPVAPKIDTTPHTPSQSQNASSSMKSHASNNFSPASPHSHPPHTQSPKIARTPTSGSPSPGVRSPMKGKSPLLVAPPHLVEPSTSLSISPPGAIHYLPVMSQEPQGSGSPTEKEPTIVEKAVGIMSSAGAFLGLWHP